jgi:hypothetical protein
MAGQLMTQTEFARHRGVGKSAVSNWKRDGLLVLAEGEGGKLFVDVTRTDAKLNAKLDPMRGRPTAAASAPAGALPFEDVPAAAAAPIGGGDSLQTVRMDLIRRQSTGHALKNAQTAGELAPVGELVERANAIGRAARERIHAWFRGEAEHFAAVRDVREIMSIGEKGIDQVFADLADQAAAGGFASEDAEDPDLEAQAEAEMEAAIVAGEAA